MVPEEIVNDGSGSAKKTMPEHPARALKKMQQSLGMTVSQVFAQAVLGVRPNRAGKLRIQTRMVGYLEGEPEIEIIPDEIVRLLQEADPCVLVVYELGGSWDAYMLAPADVPAFLEDALLGGHDSYYLFDLSFRWCLYIHDDARSIARYEPAPRDDGHAGPRAVDPATDSRVRDFALRSRQDTPDWSRVLPVLEPFRFQPVSPFVIANVDPAATAAALEDSDPSLLRTTEIDWQHRRVVSFSHYRGPSLVLGQNGTVAGVTADLYRAHEQIPDPSAVLSHCKVLTGAPIIDPSRLSDDSPHFRLHSAFEGPVRMILWGERPRPDARYVMSEQFGALAQDGRLVGFYASTERAV